MVSSFKNFFAKVVGSFRGGAVSLDEFFEVNGAAFPLRVEAAIFTAAGLELRSQLISQLTYRHDIVNNLVQDIIDTFHEGSDELYNTFACVWIAAYCTEGSDQIWADTFRLLMIGVEEEITSEGLSEENWDLILQLQRVLRGYDKELVILALLTAIMYQMKLLYEDYANGLSASDETFDDDDQ